jgi:hypothetical protein
VLPLLTHNTLLPFDHILHPLTTNEQWLLFVFIRSMLVHNTQDNSYYCCRNYGKQCCSLFKRVAIFFHKDCFEVPGTISPLIILPLANMRPRSSPKKFRFEIWSGNFNYHFLESTLLVL